MEEFRSLFIPNYYHRYHLETLNPGIPLHSDEFWEQLDPWFMYCRIIRRVGTPVVTQLISVSSQSGELFYLRVLLLHYLLIHLVIFDLFMAQNILLFTKLQWP